MAFLLFFRWWYSAGWLNSFERIGQRVSLVANDLSLPILIRTLFEPWKQITSYASPTSSLDNKFRAWFDNMFARFMGFFIRSFVIIFSFISILLVVIFGLAVAFFWPIIPILPIALVIVGLVL